MIRMYRIDKKCQNKTETPLDGASGRPMNTGIFFIVGLLPCAILALGNLRYTP